VYGFGEQKTPSPFVSACDKFIYTEILRADALAWLANNREAFDLIFVDPPFDSELATLVLADLAPHLKSGGQAYVEQGTAVIAPPGFIMHRSGRAGRSHFALLIKE
jgi:16S rRNA (guanine966-N2)-methyltransferase